MENQDPPGKRGQTLLGCPQISSIRLLSGKLLTDQLESPGTWRGHRGSAGAQTRARNHWSSSGWAPNPWKQTMEAAPASCRAGGAEALFIFSFSSKQRSFAAALLPFPALGEIRAQFEFSMSAAAKALLAICCSQFAAFPSQSCKELQTLSWVLHKPVSCPASPLSVNA